MAVQAGLSFTWSQTPEDRFSRDEAHLSWMTWQVFYIFLIEILQNVSIQNFMGPILLACSNNPDCSLFK